MYLDTYLLFAVIYNSPDIFIGAISFQTLIAIYCIMDIAIIPSAGKFWGIVYPIIYSIPLTTILNVYSYFLDTGLVGEELYALRVCIANSTVTSVLVIFAGSVFYLGKYPESRHSKVIYDYCGSHFYFHILIVLAIVAGLQSEPYVKILDARRTLL
jgi:hypothetical protein